MADTNVNGGTQQATGKFKPIESLDQTNEMEHDLSSRHVQPIAIDSIVDTGLFLGPDKLISLIGPSIISMYILVGVIMFSLMRAIGEIIHRDPSQHTFIDSIIRYLSNRWGHFAGWTYWAVLALLGMTEITAVSTYFVTFFDIFGIDLTHWKWLIELCFLVLLVSINPIAVKVFGGVGFWFSMIEITLIYVMTVTAMVMIVIGYHYPVMQIHGVGHIGPAGHAGFDNLFASFSFAPNGWMAFLMSLQMMFFAYEMIEFADVTVSETKNPRKVLPKAINEIVVYVLVFYMSALVVIMCIVPWTSFKPNKDGSFASSFIMTFQYAGLNWVSALVLFVVVIAASSVLNSPLYSAGRHLYQLSEVSPSPTLNKLGQASDRKVPARAILMSAALILLSPIVNAIPDVSGTFVLFSSVSSAVFLFIYILTLMAHRKHRRPADFIPGGLVMPTWKVLNTVAIVFFMFVYLTLFLADNTRNSAITGLVWLVGFGGSSILRERYRSRNLKTTLEHKG